MYGSGYKLMILFKQPADPAEFERRWSEEFVPLAERLPGLERVVVSRAHGGPAGPAEFYLVHELHFASQAVLAAALGSPEGVATGQCLVHLAGRLATLRSRSTWKIGLGWGRGNEYGGARVWECGG